MFGFRIVKCLHPMRHVNRPAGVFLFDTVNYVKRI